MNLLTELAKLCLRHKTVWVAYSGGMDSQVLLSLCLELRLTHNFDLHAIHIHHGLNPHADEWALHCKQYCDLHGVDYHEERVQLNIQNGDSLENVARQARYAVFSKYVEEGDILLTAHHQDDQAETLLLQLLRGAGTKGLAAMPGIKVFGRGEQGRPLLHVARADLLRYAQEKSLRWVEDDSNANTELSRNFLRHQIMPLLKSRWPTVQETLARSARHCAESQGLLEEFAAGYCLEAMGSKHHTLSVSKLLQLAPAQQRLILRCWIYQMGLPLPATSKLEAILRNVLRARWDRRPHVRWPGAELRRHRDDLYVQAPLKPHDPGLSLEWELSKPLELDGIGVLKMRAAPNTGLNPAIKRVFVRFRQGGEVVNLARRKHHDLKKLFQEWNVLPWERDRVPLLYFEDKLIAAVGYFIDPDYMVKEKETGFEVILNPAHAP